MFLPPPRCKACEACTQSTGSSSRRCLLVRATAAAAAGHAGAQLSVLGDKCVGAEVEVWWPLDEAYYKGLVREGGGGELLRLPDRLFTVCLL